MERPFVSLAWTIRVDLLYLLFLLFLRLYSRTKHHFYRVSSIRFPLAPTPPCIACYFLPSLVIYTRDEYPARCHGNLKTNFRWAFDDLLRKIQSRKYIGSQAYYIEYTNCICSRQIIYFLCFCCWSLFCQWWHDDIIFLHWFMKYL